MPREGPILLVCAANREIIRVVCCRRGLGLIRNKSRNRFAYLLAEINEPGQMIVQNPTNKSKNQNEEQGEDGSKNARGLALPLDAIR